jgi:hypothetical protein
MKKHLTQSEEFEILKLVLDKVLWLGFGLLVFGIYKLAIDASWQGGLILAGGVCTLTFIVWMLIREFEVTR